jgi:protein involved in polysaccharide export with SLBB domain
MCRTILITILSLLAWSVTEADVDTETTSYLEEVPKPNEFDYRLGPGDVVNIAVDSVPELSLKYTISETGNIMFPTLLPPLKAQGLTLEQLQILLVKLLTEYMYEPKVMVDIVEYQSHKVLVLGPFQSPGKYELRKEKVPLLDIILEAGGLRELKDNDELVILRNPDSSNSYNVDPGNSELSGMQSIRVNLQGLLRDGDLTQNVMVQAGDVIYLTSFFAAEQYVYVAGGGRRGAGTTPYEPGLTAFKALLRAGVVLDDPQALDLMIVRGRTSSERFITTRVKFDPMNPSVGDVVLSPEDIVILPEVSSQMVYVAGKVNKPGSIPFQEGLTILQAILDAGGMNKEAVGSKVKILREDAIGQKQIPVDMDAILEKGDKSQNVTLTQGDIIVVPGMSPQADITVTGKVNGPGIVPYEEGMTAMKAVFLAGGLSGSMLTSQIRIMSSNDNIQPPFMLDISKAQLEQAGSANPALKPGDLVVVMGPAPGNLVSVLGKVRRPGVIDYEDGLTALQAILRAGGFDQGAARSKVRIVRGESENQQKLRANLESLMDKGDQSGNIALLPGDIVIVPETFF